MVKLRFQCASADTKTIYLKLLGLAVDKMAVSTNKLMFYISNLQIVLILALLVVFLCFYINFLWKKRHIIMKSWNFPGPINLPIIGGAYLFMTRPENILERIVEVQKRYPEGFKIWFGSRLIYSLHEPEDIEKILVNPRLVQKDILIYKFLTDSIGDGLMSAPPVKWKKHRKHINPSFNRKVLDSFVAVFSEQSLILTEILAETVGTEPDIYGILSRCTLDIICETTMGIKLNVQGNQTDHGEVLDRIMMLIFMQIGQIWNHIDFVWKLLGHDKELKNYLKKFNDLTDMVIQQKMEALKQKSSSFECIDEAPSKRMAFLDYVMECGEFNAIELREEINILLFAGSDTSATALTFVLALLGMHPDIQQKVYEEVVEVMGTDGSPDFKNISNLVYLERVIKETLRLFPVAVFFFRAITEDVDMGHYTLPQGASVYFGPAFIHRNPKYWPDPLRFDPDRFLPEEVAKRHPCTYIPFSYGPRNCIGLMYGMMELKAIMANVIRKFKIHCAYKSIEDMKIKANIVLRFKDGAKVSLTPRTEGGE